MKTFVLTLAVLLSATAVSFAQSLPNFGPNARRQLRQTGERHLSSGWLWGICLPALPASLSVSSPPLASSTLVVSEVTRVPPTLSVIGSRVALHSLLLWLFVRCRRTLIASSAKGIAYRRR